MDKFILAPRVGLLSVNVAFLSLAYWMLNSGVHAALVSVMGVLFNLICIALDLRMLWFCKGSLSAGVFTVGLVGWYLANLVSFALLPYGKQFVFPLSK